MGIWTWKPFITIMVVKEMQVNVSRRLKAALDIALQSERSMPFSPFLDRMKKISNIFQEEGKELTENAKNRILFKRVQNNQLQDTIKALWVRFDLDRISYTEAASHLTSAVSELPEYLLERRVSSLKHIRRGG